MPERQKQRLYEQFSDALVEAFRRSHDGRSVDDVLIDDALNARFLDACLELLPTVPAAELNRRLLNLRKTGRLGRVTTKRVRLTAAEREAFVHAAEIAARQLEDKYDLTVDRVFCEPARRKEFDRVASSIAPGFTPYQYRKAALLLRKARGLRPEPIKRLEAFDANVILRDAADFEADPDLLPDAAGIYAFVDDTGYLYIGEASRLRPRLRTHLDHSDRKALAHHLWEHGTGKIKLQLYVFPEGSEGAKTRSRKAFEAALIASRAPRFNVQCRS
ncbi:GIY-YIG nuclease family protein [bacterium]|nr:GIY-YIG nuclease family protein [bacterium]